MRIQDGEIRMTKPEAERLTLGDPRILLMMRAIARQWTDAGGWLWVSTQDRRVGRLLADGAYTTVPRPL